MNVKQLDARMALEELVMILVKGHTHVTAHCHSTGTVLVILVLLSVHSLHLPTTH